MGGPSGNQTVACDLAREFFPHTYQAAYPLFVLNQMLMGFMIDQLQSFPCASSSNPGSPLGPSAQRHETLSGQA